MATPCLLALDTSTERLVIALVDGERHWRHDEAGGAAASARLLPAIRELMLGAGVPMAALEAVAFARGPGAFTGLRTACAVAQGLALGLAKPVLAIDSLEIVADEARAQCGDAANDVWVAMDARMEEAYAARYRWSGSAWRAVVAPALWTLEALAQAWREQPAHCVAGSALDAFGDRLPAPGALRVPAPADRAAALARLALRAVHAGAGVDAAEALPVYLRDKVALTTAERLARAAPA